MANKVALEHVSVAALKFPVVNLSLHQCFTNNYLSFRKLTMDQKQAVIPYSLIHRTENKNKQEFKKVKKSPYRPPVAQRVPRS
jgi:hypothetical protein